MRKIFEILMKNAPDSLGGILDDGDLSHFIQKTIDACLPLPDTHFWDTYYLHDGLTYNGVEIFSVNPNSISGFNYILLDLFESNVFFHEYYSDYSDYFETYLYIGRSDEDLFVYDIKTKQYAALAREDLMVYESCDNLYDLIRSYF